MRGGSFGRGRGGGTRYSNYTRGDMNMFAMLSDQDGDSDSGDDIFSDSAGQDQFQTVEHRCGKRRRQNTSENGPTEKGTDIFHTEEIDFASLNSEDKLNLILSKVSLSECRFERIEGKLGTLVENQKKINNIEKVLRSHEARIRLLEYKSIDIEARGRRKNLLFYGFEEERNEVCRDKVRNFVMDKFDIHPDCVGVERAHRVGRFNPQRQSPRPIIAVFRDYITTENIISQGRLLRGTQYGVSRDYPVEIKNARRLLWDDLKAAKRRNPAANVSIGFPAKLSVNGQIVSDLFPEWDDILRGSRIDGKHISQKSIYSKAGPLSATTQAYTRPDVNNSQSIFTSHSGQQLLVTESAKRKTSPKTATTPHPETATSAGISGSTVHGHGSVDRNLSPNSFNKKLDSALDQTKQINRVAEPEQMDTNIITSADGSASQTSPKPSTSVKHSTETPQRTEKPRGRSITRGPSRAQSRSVSKQRLKQQCPPPRPADSQNSQN